MTEELKAELLPCPFCGKPPKVCPDTSYGAATVFCPDENDCSVQPVADADLKAGETVADAIARWNDRTPADAGEVREKVARIIDPFFFKSWQSMIEYCEALGGGDEVGLLYANASYLKTMEEARVKADQILSLLSPTILVEDVGELGE